MKIKNVMIYGAGQAGEMAAQWLPGNCKLMAFIDGNPAKQDSTLCGVPVISPDAAFNDAAKHPDAVYLCVINKDAAEDIRDIIASYRYNGEIIDVPGLRDIADIRLSFLRLKAREIKETGIVGDIAELGVYRGDFAGELNALFPERELLLFDTFEGFDEKDLAIEKEKARDGRNAKASAGDFGDTSIEIVRKKMTTPENVFFCKGYFPESLKKYRKYHLEERQYCIVSLDTDLYEPTYEGLKYFYKKTAPGGVIIIHDYNSSQYPGVKRAVRDFALEEEDVYPIPLMDLHGTAVIAL